MQIRMFALILCFVGVFASASAQEKVRVRIHKRVKQIDLQVEKATWQECSLTMETCKVIPIDATRIQLQVQNGWIHWNDQKFQKDFRYKLQAKKVYDLSHGQNLPLELSFVLKKDSFDLIAHLDMENYLFGVLPSEMPAGWPLESLKAQAVASRSYVLSQMRNNRRLHFDVDGDIMDQVFKKHLPSPSLAKVRLALDATKGEVITRGSLPVKAYFHSHCGGHTEMASNVWPGSLGFETVKDPFCTKRNSLSWSYQVSYQYLTKLYKDSTQDANVGLLEKVQAGERNTSGRLESLYLFFDDQKIRRWSALSFRESIGYGKVKSTRFELENLSKDKSLKVFGAGFGHGVGLCQHGARVMAEKGFKYKKILEHYYPLTRLSHSKQLEESPQIANRSGAQ